MCHSLKNLVPTTLLILVLAATAWGENDFAARFESARKSGDEKQCQTVLAAWKLAQPDDVEYNIAAANDLLGRESGVLVSTKKAATGDMVVADPKTGREVGSISRGGPSRATYQHAIALLQDALAKAPSRMDVYLGLAILYQNSGDDRALVEVLTKMAVFARKSPGALLGQHGKPFASPADENLALAINGFANHYFQRNTKDANAVFRDLGKLDADAFPNRVYGHNLVGIYYTTIDNQPALALASYERALKIAPDDSYVWMNVGLLQAKGGDKTKATASFNKIVELNDDASCVEQARTELAKLK